MAISTVTRRSRRLNAFSKAAITLFEPATFNHHAHPPHPHADAYADSEYDRNDYIQP
jgi:hypothetical protein